MTDVVVEPFESKKDNHEQLKERKQRKKNSL